MNNARLFFSAGVLGATLASALIVRAQQWTPPTPKNLQVLDKGTSGRDVVLLMKTFTQGLGVRCEHCHTHMGSDPSDLSAFDFASDDKPEKKTARAMMRMTSTINDDLLKGIGDPAPPGELKVTCYSCHRGEKKPLTRKPQP